MKSSLDQVYVKRLFDEPEISYLREIFDSDLETEKGTWQCISNIFKHEDPVIKKYVESFIKKKIDWATAFTKQEWRLKNVFLLEYHPGGEATLHIDNHSVVGGMSFVTLVEEEDLIGGDIIIQEANVSDGDPTIKENISVIDPNDHANQHKVPLKVGETIIYNASVIHGVTKIKRGFRRVLVAWLVPRKAVLPEWTITK